MSTDRDRERREALRGTQPENFFDRALAAAESIDALRVSYSAASGLDPEDIYSHNGHRLRVSDLDLVCRALREAIALNRGIRSENEGLSARLRAQNDASHTDLPERPSEALLAAARAVLAANQTADREQVSAWNDGYAQGRADGEAETEAFRDCSHPNCAKHGKSPCEGIDCHGNEIPEVDGREVARSMVAGYTPEQLAEAGIV